MAHSYDLIDHHNQTAQPLTGITNTAAHAGVHGLQYSQPDELAIRPLPINERYHAAMLPVRGASPIGFDRRDNSSLGRNQAMQPHLQQHTAQYHGGQYHGGFEGVADHTKIYTPAGYEAAQPILSSTK